MTNLVIGNHRTIIGVWEQVEVVRRAFKAMEEPLMLASRIIPNDVNIIVEDLNSALVREMKATKRAHPETKYVLYATEYLTHYGDRGGKLNIFSYKAHVIRWLHAINYQIAGDTYNHFLGQSLIDKIRLLLTRAVMLPLSKLDNALGFNYDIETMMARRQACLNSMRNHFDGIIANTEAVLRGYGKFLNCPDSYLPTFIDKTRARNNRKKSKKHAAVFFSGRLTRYREEKLKELGRSLTNAYPFPGGETWSSTNEMSKDAAQKVALLAVEEEAMANSISLMALPALNLPQNDIYSYLNSDNTAAYELYIKQNVNWQYSSPQRTLLSIESGFIPMDYGHFDDHDINALSLDVQSPEDISSQLSKDLVTAYRELDGNVTSYNEAQKSGLPALHNMLLALTKTVG